MNLQNTRVFGSVRTEIRDVKSGLTVHASPWKHNLVQDNGLNALSNALGLADFFATCKISAVKTPNQFSSGAVTFTQSGTTITASAGFFTSAMTGAILKYGSGSGGAETYITFVNTTTVTASVSMTVASPTAGTVWMVQQTALDATGLRSSNTYDSAGNSTVLTTNQAVMQRTFKFPVSGSTYNVNQIGYVADGVGGAMVYGSFPLATTDVISPSQFYVVVLQMTFIVFPGAPTAVLNTGTGIDTSGNLMLQFWDMRYVLANGNSSNYQGQTGNVMDGFVAPAASVLAAFIGTAPTLNTNPSTGQVTTTNTNVLVLGNLPGITNFSTGVGTSTCTFTFSASAQIVTAFYVGHFGGGNFVAPVWVLVLTNPFTLPSGLWGGTVIFSVTFTRNLVN